MLTLLKKHIFFWIGSPSWSPSKTQASITEGVRPELFVRVTYIAVVTDVIVTSIADAERGWTVVNFELCF